MNPEAMTVTSIRSGKVGILTPPDSSDYSPNRWTNSAYNKQSLESPVHVSALGIKGDEHVYKDHGGVDAALCVYPTDHTDFWRSHGLDLGEGDFGENLSTQGFTEASAAIGMRLRTASGVVVEISEPRAPCFKLGIKTGFRKMPTIMAEAGNTGWMMRVITPGEICLLYTSPSPRDRTRSRMPSSA